MKRIISFIVASIIASILSAEDVKLIKVAEFQNNPKNKNTISMRLDVGNDDISGNTMLISSKGEILIHCRDENEVFCFDSKNERLNPLFDTNFLPAPNFAFFNQVTENYYLFFGNNGNFYLVDKDYNLKASISILHNWNIRTYFYYALYDEDTDILFLIDGDKGIHSIEHPSLDENQNQKNYRNADETMKKLNAGEYAPHLTLDKNNRLCVDGIRYKWNGEYDYQYYETKNYIISLIAEDNYINVYDRTESEYLYYTLPEKEEVESITYHPNGDWYFLTINWATNIHTLWRIENTWDTQWRKEWYENHETENVSQTVSSTNVAVNKEMTCGDNLRLRSEEATSSKVITTMQKGTQVKILKLGKAETIDGITSNWVQVEVLADAKDKDGKSIKAGIVGWCYGGYLE